MAAGAPSPHLAVVISEGSDEGRSGAPARRSGATDRQGDGMTAGGAGLQSRVVHFVD